MFEQLRTIIVKGFILFHGIENEPRKKKTKQFKDIGRNLLQSK